jgi:hypothetical protein
VTQDPAGKKLLGYADAARAANAHLALLCEAIKRALSIPRFTRENGLNYSDFQ